MTKSTQLALPGLTAAAVVVSKPEKRWKSGLTVIQSADELVRCAATYAVHARAARTIETYGERWRGFDGWCSARGLDSLPCTSATLTAFVMSEAQRGVKPKSIELSLTAIGRRLLDKGIPRSRHPHRDSRFAEVWAGIRVKHGIAPRRVAPLMAADLRKAVADLPDTTAGKRDRAMLTLGFSGAFRRCELVALMVPDVTFHADGLVVTVRRSKGDQESQGATVAIPYGAVEAACPVRAVRAWLACLQAAGITAGPVFRRVWAHGRIGRHALRGGAVAVIVKQQATAAGLDARTFSGHSLRAGLATSAAQAGKSPFAIRDQGRWAGVASIEGYIRQGQQFTDFNAAKGL